MTAMTQEQHSFAERIHAAQGILHRICAVYSQDKESHNDLRQEILLQLWRSYLSFRNQSTFSTWMYRVALNTALMHRRRQERHRLTVSLDDVDPPQSNDHGAAEDEDVQLLYRCIQQLPTMDRAIILMQLEQKSYQEIADVVGLSEGNVSVRIVRIKQKLRTLLEECGYERREVS